MPRKSRRRMVGRLEERLNEERANDLRELLRELYWERRRQEALEPGERAPVYEDEQDGQCRPGDHE